MAFLGQDFVVEEIANEAGAFDPIPAGWYNASIVSAELKETKAGNGQYIKIRFDVTGPSYQGRVVWGQINIKNPNPTAEQIGRQQLGDLARAIGLERVSDSDQLVGGNLQIKVKVKKDEIYGDGNDVKGFKALDSSAPPTKQAAAAGTAPKSSTPPWAK
jgi:hypothetical protein